MSLKLVDLFSGCGGFSQGFKKAGFQVLISNEFWEPAQKTFIKNHKDTILIKEDITKKETKRKILEKTSNQKIDLVIGGPPCQAYSMSGKRDPKDKRAKLYKDYLKVIEMINPKGFVLENVKGLKNAKNEKKELYLDLIKNGFRKLGYDFVENVYDSSDYGIPQKRERLIIIGFKKNLNLLSKFNEPEKVKNKKTVKEAIYDLENKKEDKNLNHIFSEHSKEFIEKIKDTKIGTNIYSTYSDSYFRCFPDKPSRTVKENHGSVFIHYEKNRVMTPRELARLQSFPDSFLFEGSKGQILTQIGNAVPPLLAEKIAIQIKKVLI